VYLDSNALLKRYVKEVGSTSLDHLFFRAGDSQQPRLVSSAWNIREVLEAPVQRHQKKLFTEDEFSSAVLNFSDETLPMTRQGSTQVLAFPGKLLTASWRILQREHI
jgi:predicted nucleic acid-binding protein